MRARAILVCAALSAASLPRGAGAQPAAPPAEEVREAARAAANRGLRLFDAGKYEEALVAFREAEERYHAPTLLIMMARALDKLGRLVEARAVYQAVLDEALAHYAPAEFFEAQADARKELPPLAARIPTLEVTISGAPAQGVEVDGQPVPAGAGRLAQNPGQHTVIVTAAGRQPVRRNVMLAEGAAERVEIDLGPAAPPAPVGSDRPATPPAISPGTPAPRGYVVPAVVAFGVGGAAQTIGGITGPLALGEVSTLEERCPDHACYDDAAEPYDGAHTLATASTISFVVAGAATAAGVALLLWPADRGPAKATAAIGPGWVGVKGSF